MGTESRMRSAVIRALRPYHPVAVENPACPGTPDLNCTLGWLELKQLTKWPVRAGTAVRIPHFTPHQRLWLRQRWQADQKCWLLLKVSREWLLFDGRTAFIHVGGEAQETLKQLALLHTKGLDSEALIACMKTNWNHTSS